MSVDKYKSISSATEGLYKEKGSKFIAFAYPISCLEEVRERVDELKVKFHDARHHCYAYILGANQEIHRANDDGEPSNSAGIPIYNQIRSFELSDVLVVVVRYFGGTKLGVPGLVNAYKLATEEALNQAEIIDKWITKRIKIQFSYQLTSEVMKVLHELPVDISEKEYTDITEFTLEVLESKYRLVLDSLNKLHGLNLKELS